MDKAIVALAAAEDNAAAIKALRAELRALGGEKKPQFSPPYRPAAYSANGKTSFGRIRSDGTAVIVVFFSSTISSILYFGDTRVATGTSQIVTAIPAGEGELYIDKIKTVTNAVIFGGVTKL